MTVKNFADLAIGTNALSIWSISDEREIWKGNTDEIPEKYQDAEVNSWDLSDLSRGVCLTLNID